MAVSYLASSNWGMISRHMLLHIVTMNFAAPLLCAAVLRRRNPASLYSVPGLIVASAFQLLLLCLWHTPRAMAAAMAAPELAAAMHISLFLSALWFWRGIYQQASIHIWTVLAVLLVTGKLYCLLAALLVFAPRVLFPVDATIHASTLADQQLAGVMMVVACPLSYILVATILTARWITTLQRAAARESSCVTAGQ